MKMRMMKSASLIKVLPAVFILTISTILLTNTLVKPKSSQADYPVLPEMDALAAMRKYTDLSDLIHSTGLILEGTVVETLPVVKISISPKLGSPEAIVQDKAGIERVDIENYPVIIRIEKVLKGSPCSQDIILNRSSLFIHSEPELPINSRMVFFLEKKEGEDSYVTVASQESYFYISDDRYIYPAVLTDATRASSGMRLIEFEAQITSARTTTK